MTLAATLRPVMNRHGETKCCANAKQSPAEHLAGLLDAIVLDGNVRAMEGVACTLVRAGSRMQIVADHVLSARAHPVRLPLPGSASRSLAMRTARRALAGSIDDPSRGALAFHRIGDMPAWARSARPLTQIGEIVFYAVTPDILNAGLSRG
jgi:hypothetical protein